jgi:HD-GYP domain-containing protein (c-di-GMP phosphodiesterase class II)
MEAFDAPLGPAMKHNLVQSQERLPDQIFAMARSVVSLIGFRDQYTSSHSGRVANYVRAIATQLGLPDEETETAVSAATLHDIGKIAIADHILLKRDKLNNEESAFIKKYPEWGWMTLREYDGFERVALLILHQHDHFDGSGSPGGLKGQEIPLGSRIIAVADSYDAQTTDRPYREALSASAALAELIRCAGTQFDPEVVNAFRVVLERQTVENEMS